MAEAARRARVEQLLAAGRVLADPEHEAARALRRELLASSRLSVAGVELGLSRCLETQVSDQHLSALLASTPIAPRAHVLLSGNVFVAALRAIAIAVAASPRVSVRASRRDPALARALCRLAPGLFELVDQLAPQPGDHVWGYGSDETLASVRAGWPRGVWLHAHGHGVGAVVVEWTGLDLSSAARAIALDTAVFDQQGCLSPRAVLLVGSESQTRELGRALAEALRELESAVPPGPLDATEQAEARRNADAARYAFELFEAGTGWVCLGHDSAPVFPTTRRCLHLVRSDDPPGALAPFESYLTCIGSAVSEPLGRRLREAFPGARHVALGDMQRPPLDGPVDQRHDPAGELL